MNVKEEEEKKVVNESVLFEDAAINDDEEEEDDMVTSSSSSNPGSPVRNEEGDEVDKSANGNIQPNLFEEGDMEEEEEENEDLGVTKLITKKQEEEEEKKEISSVLLCADLSSDAIMLPTFLSDRFRNAWIRVRQNPLTDTEAWKALITEAQMGFKEEEIKTTNNWTKLDLLESVYGALLNHFPYSPYAISAVMEFLFALSADEAFVLDGTNTQFVTTTTTTSTELSRRRAAADLKLTALIQNVLGVQPSSVTTTTTTTTTSTEEDDARSKVRSNMLTSHGPLWKIYIQKVSRDTQRKYSSIYNPEEARQTMIQAFENALNDNNLMVVGAHLIWRQYISYLQYDEQQAEETTTTTKQQQRYLLLRQVYQRCIAIPMQDLDIFWQEYTNLERHISEVLSQPLLAEHLPKYQHAKQVYVERLAYLQTTPELLVLSSSSLSANNTNHLRLLSIPPDNSENERNLIRHYFQRIAYERTNSERLSSAELVKRVRQAYKDTICIFMRHVEVWQDWASYEHAANTTTTTNAGVDLANEIYTFGMEFCSSALLAASHSELLECAGQIPAAIHILDNFCTQHPCSLGFIVLQRICRRTQGIQAARNIFKRARQTLISPPEDTLPTTTTTTMEQPHSKTSSEAGDATMVTEWTMNRIKPKTSAVSTSTTNVTNADATKMNTGATTSTSTVSGKSKSVGYITWHLYASHAHMELRCNKCPQVAARVFELGLSKHRSFITCPSYIQAYSQLLLERGDDDNMRSLLERAIAACQQEGKSRNRQRLLWDMLLEFECNDAQTFGDPKIIRSMEARRCRALPPDYDGTANESDHLPKALQEQLARVDGENAGLISGGLGRLLRRFELIGLLGSGGEQEDVSALLGETSENSAATYGGRRSDASFAYRYHGLSSQSELSGVATTGAGLTDRSRAARERAQAATGQQQTLTTATKFTDALHPEWLRTLLSMLPVQRMQRINARPPPHMIEMALAALRTRALPATRPAAVSADGVANHTTGRKRRLGDDDDSSDDDTDARGGGGGYSAQFRMRQRARQEASSF